MAQYKDTERSTWYCKFYFTDWTGQRKQKLKRGFSTKREATAWERDFLERQQGNPDMTFQALYDLYVDDIGHRLKDSTIETKRYACEKRIVPIFKLKPINQITPADIRKWQNDVIKSGAKDTYQRQLYNQLNAIMNFAVKYYGLSKNPCAITGSMGKMKANRMEFWTLDEFNSFIAHVDKLAIRTAFMLLYYSGLRCGELLALNIGDIDFQNGIIQVTKTHHRMKGKDVTTSPKTPGSVRAVMIPSFLVNYLKDYISHIYEAGPEERLFYITRSKLFTAMNNACRTSGVKKIRIHDIRHSHVSLLIDMGFPPLLIAERIGDTVDMINNIYGHLYPNRHTEVATKLQELVSK